MCSLMAMSKGRPDKGSQVTLRLVGLEESSSSAIGSLLRRRSTEYGSFFFVERLVRKWSSAVCDITLVFPGTDQTLTQI